MPKLHVMLRDSDDALLKLLAERWNVDVRRLSKDEQITALEKAMLDPQRLEAVFEALQDQERGALQTLAGAQPDRNQMNHLLFEAMFGQIRRLGQGGIEREKPHLNPQSAAESLYYKGLIGYMTGKLGPGLGTVICVPDDVAALLPLHKTGYSAEALEAETVRLSTETGSGGTVGGGFHVEQVAVLEADDVFDAHPADTSILDDMTSLLAYIRLQSAHYHPLHGIDDEARNDLMPHLLWEDNIRLDFIVATAIDAALLEVQGGKLYNRRAEMRSWLESSRAAQLRILTEAWLKGEKFPELFFTPNLTVEEAGSYDPAAAREILLDALRSAVPHDDWWAVDTFIEVMHARYHDFQRPGGDYDSWYIRNDSGEYLRGPESWHAVDGAVLEFYLIGPMHWLGMLDIAENAARFNAYGRGLLENRWVNTSDPTDDPITLQADGTLTVSRRLSRYDRFQLARFTSWVTPATLTGNPYVYKLDAEGIQRAAEQGITVEQITKFITRATGAALPESVNRLLQNWATGPTASVTLEEHIIIRTTAVETLNAIFNDPKLRRFLGARLGETACIVRKDQWRELVAALGEHGINVERLF